MQTCFEVLHAMKLQTSSLKASALAPCTLCACQLLTVPLITIALTVMLLCNRRVIGPYVFQGGGAKNLNYQVILIFSFILRVYVHDAND
jgi:hypothetical protein